MSRRREDQKRVSIQLASPAKHRTREDDRMDEIEEDEDCHRTEARQRGRSEDKGRGDERRMDSGRGNDRGRGGGGVAATRQSRGSLDRGGGEERGMGAARQSRGSLDRGGGGGGGMGATRQSRGSLDRGGGEERDRGRGGMGATRQSRGSLDRGGGEERDRGRGGMGATRQSRGSLDRGGGDERDRGRGGMGAARQSRGSLDRGGGEERGVVVVRQRGRSVDGGGREGGGMSLVKQSTLLNYHVAMEDSVDIDKVWPDLQGVFHDHEQDEIQEQPTKTLQMQKLLDILVNKDDYAFDVLVDALQPQYEWLAVRLQRGLKDEGRRVNKLGKGIRRKIALAMLTARVSDRQKDYILDQVTSVVHTEITHKVNRVNVPDHRAAAQLDREHRLLRDLVRYEVDPLLYGEDPSHPERADHNYDDIVGALQSKLEDLRGLQRCYIAMNLGMSMAPTLPSLLLEKIDEVKLRIKTLQKEKEAVLEESEALNRTVKDQQRSLSRLEQHNRNLELENNNLESERQQLEHSTRKQQEERREVEKGLEKVREENRDLLSEIQQTSNKLSSLALRTRSLDFQNSKLVRDNVKLSAANSTLRKEARNNGTQILLAVKSENKRLAADRVQIKKDLHRVESERRQLAIRSQKLEMENRNLRDQKVRLVKDRRKSVIENRALKAEAKRLALGKYSPLPAIGESSDDLDDLSTRSLSLSMTSQSRHGAHKKVRRSDSYTLKPDHDSKTPWNKYKEDDTEKSPKDKGHTSHQEREKDGKGESDDEGRRSPGYMKPTNSSKGHDYMEDEGRRSPGYMKPTNSSKGHDYMEDEGRGSPCPRRAVAR